VAERKEKEMRKQEGCEHDWILFFRNRKAWLRCAFCQKEILHPLEEGKEIKEGKRAGSK